MCLPPHGWPVSALVSPATGTLDEASLAALRQTRSAVRDALEGRGAAPLNAVLDRGRVRLTVSDTLVPARTLQADEPASQSAVLAAESLLELLENGAGPSEICENPDCVLWFFDTTRNGTRRWCSMAVCGNRMKARRHGERKGAATSAGRRPGDSTGRPRTARVAHERLARMSRRQRAGGVP